MMEEAKAQPRDLMGGGRRRPWIFTTPEEQDIHGEYFGALFMNLIKFNKLYIYCILKRVMTPN